MSIGSVSFNYTLNNFEIKKTFDARINIKTELEYLRFSSSFSEQDLGLSYISSPGINTDKNVLLVDTSNNITSNAKESFEESEYLSADFMISYAGFYISDVVKTISGIETPLYYWHDLTTAGNFNNLEILDANKLPIDKNLYSYYDETTTLGYARKGIYSNLICSINQKENRYEVFYVRYKSLDTNLVVEELLDSKVFYEQASYIATRNQREYVVSQVGNEYNIKLVFDSFNYGPTPAISTQRFWFKRKKQSKITIENPGIVSSTERWNMRISPGDFYANDKKYWVPEYYLQQFSPAFPYRLIKEKEIVVVNKNLLFVDNNPIANIDTSGYYIYITIKETNGAVKRVFTNDPDADTYITKQGFVTDIFYEKDTIESVSANSGFILLNQDIPDGHKAYITCRYIERYYSYDYLSVNPSINSEVLGKKLVFYIVPDQTERSVHHLVVDPNNIIVDASETIYADGIITFTLEEWEVIAENLGLFKIGEVYVVQSLSISDIGQLDTRILGGGVAEKNIEAALKLQNEAAWYWDIGNWDGTTYPGMGAIVVHLPRYILKELGGDFEREQVADIVKRHAASGSYIIVRYYDESTEITNILPGDKQATVTWRLVNANQYNIYIGNSPDNLSLYLTVPGTRTSILIPNLENEKYYYVKVAPIVGGIERLGSKTLGFMPFNYSSTLPIIKYGEGKFIQGTYE
jgi:hypothetical protein